MKSDEVADGFCRFHYKNVYQGNQIWIFLRHYLDRNFVQAV